jgi:probable rRNA maturation factor
MAIELANESGLPIDESALVALGRHVLSAMGVHPLAELSVLLVDEKSMTALHERWMNEPGPTDVLAFPMDELDPAFRTGRGTDDDADPAPTLLGDIVLCPQVARQQAQAAGHGAEDELHLLATHGILHLLGYDHGEPAQEQEMFRRQTELLTSWQQARQPPDPGQVP